MKLPIALMLLLLPSAWLAWNWRGMPQLGFYHDDSLYLVCGKSLAEGAGYRIASLPGQPYQTKYPPLFPAILAVVWRASPSFPANLPWTVLAVWLVFPIYLWLARGTLRNFGFTGWRLWGLTALIALNPLAVLLSFSLMPELLAGSLLLGSFFILRANRPAWAGALAGLAYLAKSAVLPVFLTGPLVLVCKTRDRTAAMKFFAAMLPAVAAWQWWVWTHISPGQDLVTLYYTNYVGFQKFNVPWQDLGLVVWHNLDAYLMAVGKLLTFDVSLFESKHLERVAAVAALSGVWRLAKRTHEWQYPAAAAGITAILLVWHYQPDQRFVFILYPLLLAGLATEIENVVGALKVSWRKPTRADRVAAVGIGAVLAGFALFVAAAHLYGVVGFLPMILQNYQEDAESRQSAYQWLSAHTPVRAAVLAYDDPLVYLYSRRPGTGLPVPTKFYYHEDQPGIDRFLDAVPRFARERQLDYILLTNGDFYRDLHESGAHRVWRAVTREGTRAPVFHAGGVSIYTVD